jgi:hypothetical protein
LRSQAGSDALAPSSQDNPSHRAHLRRAVINPLLSLSLLSVVSPPPPSSSSSTSRRIHYRTSPFCSVTTVLFPRSCSPLLFLSFHSFLRCERESRYHCEEREPTAERGRKRLGSVYEEDKTSDVRWEGYSSDGSTKERGGVSTVGGEGERVLTRRRRRRKERGERNSVRPAQLESRSKACSGDDHDLMQHMKRALSSRDMKAFVDWTCEVPSPSEFLVAGTRGSEILCRGRRGEGRDGGSVVG